MRTFAYVVVGLCFKSLRPQALSVLLLSWPQWARRGPYLWACDRLMDRWHPEMRRVDDPGDCGCCALDEDHDGPCQWKCTTCAGTGRCPECGDVIEDDIDWCEFCENNGCPAGCFEGWITEDVGA